LIFDGDCDFCSLWIQRWRDKTGAEIEYVPFQDAGVAARFPELPRDLFEKAAHLVEEDGSVFSGAEAVLRTLGHGPHESLLLEWYFRWPAFARLAEAAYRFIATHRPLFSKLTRMAWGRHLEPPSHLLVRWLFLKSLGVVYLIAFLSLSVQVMGLIGSKGILPTDLTMFGFRQEANLAHLGVTRYHAVPTLCWISASDGFLKFQCAAGVGLAILVIIDIAPAPCLFLLWLIYLSLSVVFREFLAFQWDSLLLEIGFLSIFFAPLQWLPRRLRSPPPSRLVLWLLRWLLFRLMLGSGLVKLLSGDGTWRNMTALRYHYETQPLPTWIGWYAHQLPLRAQQISALLLFGIELVLPFLIFAPRRLRQIPCVGFIVLQTLIMLTGNYCFFNLLSILLCLVLLDDAAVAKLIPVRLRGWLLVASDKPQEIENAGKSESPAIPSPRSDPPSFSRRWPIQITVPLICIAILLPLMQFGGMFRVHIPWPSPLVSAYRFASPFRSFNNYGLFAVMTTNRPEIVIQGSRDGVTWLDYEFRYKPGDVRRRPGFVEPHQPRLDWQMWFAALSDYQHNLWFVEFCARILNGSPEVTGLLERNPFPKTPPRYLRAVVYEYHFTDFATRRRTGAWWHRERKSDYLPVISRQREAR
jgi:predicted DCC family thiol-disulfide oxidoreductase YuxK